MPIVVKLLLTLIIPLKHKRNVILCNEFIINAM